MKKFNTTLFGILTCISTSTEASDWPMFRGPEHNGISKETSWRKTWPKTGPPKLWEASVGTGFSSMSVADGKLFTLGNQDKKDTVYALDAVSGKTLWTHVYESKIGAKFYEGGPGSTPTVDLGKVYVLSKWGDLFCLDGKQGHTVWQRQLEQEEGLRLPDWGFNGSPLVHGDHLILNVGGGGMAVDKKTGKTIWLSNDEESGYSTPLPFEIADKTYVALSSGNSFLAADPTTGSKIWEIKWPTRYGVNAADPIIVQNEVWVGSGYGKGHGLFKLNGAVAEVAWTNRELRTQQNAPVLLGGHLFGFDGNGGSRAPLKCIERKTGKVVWEESTFKYGSVAAADEQLIILSAQGELLIAPASPEGFLPTARAKVLNGKCWTVPVLSNGLIYVRNSKGRTICLDVRL
ncbi:MAG: PQQ-binding-like beta-propeller repeat protein [Verrucomicrobiota bacterium]|nr:PQQ-binding-like beta-propeller repeat protein [Verrucomicrobiota bacterium]